MPPIADLDYVLTLAGRTASNRLKVRTLHEGEPLPQIDLGTHTLPSPDPNWIWVAELDGEVVGTLVGVPAHGLILLLRLVTTSKAPQHTVLALFRKAWKDCLQRGVVAYITFLTKEHTAEMKMGKITRLFGGLPPLPFDGFICSGVIKEKR